MCTLLFLNHLTCFICNNSFCRTVLFITTTPSIVTVAGYHNYHGIDFGIHTIIMPCYTSFSFTCSSIRSLFLVLETAISTKQWSLPLIPINFLQQLGWITFLHSATSHFSKLSFTFLHFECNLNVWSIGNLCDKRVTRIQTYTRIKNAHPLWIFSSIKNRFYLNKNME